MPDSTRGVSRSGSRLGALIAEARKAQKMTQRQLETASGVPERTIIRWENEGVSRPDPTKVLAVCAALGLDSRVATSAIGYATVPEAA